VVASLAAKWLGVAGDASGKIVVGPDLSVPGHQEVFAIGDTAHAVASSRNLIGIRSREPMVHPGVAQPAIQEGKYVSRLIRRRLKNRPALPPFRYWDKGNLAIIGSDLRSCGSALRAHPGIPGVFVWVSVDIYFPIGFANRVFCATAMGLRFCYEAAARAGS
jgi:NADH:ubiquinone reductase (H+-translocating)